ncbi:hypothetical protein [Burkholderia vietnamiensis]|uniref:hypothetical protein n=1 Tax=Burkholderia vietnamiensis TaxID=60552 RepID=UPI001CB34EFA|nr:hypothetical protein [Burkholderia vietnamiensis]CAG9232378.1 hypothetical protein BVI1335_830056 [Burkholderia vietnamiensis]
MEPNLPLELFVDDVAGVLYGLSISKIVFTSAQPQREGKPVDKNVLSLVMPTDSLLQFCVSVLGAFARNEQEMGRYLSERADEMKSALALVKELVESESYKKLESSEEEAKPTPKKRSRAKVH